MKFSPNKKKIITLALIGLIATNLITYYFTLKLSSETAANQASDPVIYADHPSCPVKIQRLNGFDYIKPVLFVDRECESDMLNPIKQSLLTLIDSYKKIGTLNSASVFLKEYSANEWMGINHEEKFLPGSLMKVPELIAFLKMEETNPGTLNQKIRFEKTVELDKHPKYISKSIQIGQSYTVRELLTYMIVYSDNNATSLLFSRMDINVFKKVFTDMGLPAPDMTAQNYPISAKDYSIFMRILYNSSYLNNKNSEFATELLGKCNFKEGLVSGLPSNVKAAHKFGESGDPLEKDFSESAIVYLNNNPYVLTVMVKGKDPEPLPGIVKQVSDVVYQGMSARF